MFAAATGTTSSALLQMQAPTDVTNLTADPPEDLTILRIVGDFNVIISGAPATWVLALIVQDQTWTPGATFAVDADKRILWSQTYITQHTDTTHAWDPPGTLGVNGAVVGMAPEKSVHVDISPKVKVECGKALFLVAYENAGAETFSCGGHNMRLLFQRSRRR